MAADSDQNPESKNPSEVDKSSLSDALSDDASVEEMNFDEIDSVIGESDPHFLKSVSAIKIDAKVDLNNTDEFASAVQIFPKQSLSQLLKKPFQYRDNPKLFVKFWGAVVLIIALITGTWLNKKSVISDKLFLQSYAELVKDVNEYNPLTETESFYDNPQFSKNLMTMSRLLANIKESENSGPNPMVIMEINVEGLSAEAIIELKDREAEFKDMLLRHTESKSYDDLVVAKGKQDLCDDFRGIINTYLTQGQVRKVFLNNFVINP